MKQLAGLAFAVCALALAVPARADVVSDNYQFRGDAAEGSFYWSDDCSYGSAYVAGGSNVSHVVRGAPVSSAYAYAYVWGYNWCTGTDFQGWGSTDTARIDRLNTAAFSVPMTLSSFSCTWDEALGWYTCSESVIGSGTFDAVVTGTGDVQRGVSMNNWSAGTYRSTSRNNGSWRGATVAGSLVVGGTDYLAAANASWGSISYNSSSSHTFYRY